MKDPAQSHRREKNAVEKPGAVECQANELIKAVVEPTAGMFIADSAAVKPDGVIKLANVVKPDDVVKLDDAVRR